MGACPDAVRDNIFEVGGEFSLRLLNSGDASVSCGHPLAVDVGVEFVVAALGGVEPQVALFRLSGSRLGRLVERLRADTVRHDSVEVLSQLILSFSDRGNAEVFDGNPVAVFPDVRHVRVALVEPDVTGLVVGALWGCFAVVDGVLSVSGFLRGASLHLGEVLALDVRDDSRAGRPLNTDDLSGLGGVDGACRDFDVDVVAGVADGDDAQCWVESGDRGVTGAGVGLADLVVNDLLDGVAQQERVVYS